MNKDFDIVGDGDIASVIRSAEPKTAGLLFFASGVSNSQETDENEYEREIELLSMQDTKRHVVYFSSLSLFYYTNRYQDHKWQMETLVKEWFPKHTIVRLGNISWGDNPHTLINYLSNHPKAPIRDEYRYVVDLPEFLHWMGLIPDWNCEMNVPGRMLKVKDIKERYCE